VKAIKQINKLAALTTMLTLSACAGYSNKYSCPPAVGMPCKSITEIQNMLDNNVLPTITNHNSNNSKTTIVTTTINPKANTTGSQHKGRSIIRVPEETMSIFVAAYEDENAVYHHDNTLSIVTKKAHWKTVAKGK